MLSQCVDIEQSVQPPLFSEHKQNTQIYMSKQE